MKKLLLLSLFAFSINCFAIDHFILKESIGDCSKSQIVYSGPKALEICSKKGECVVVEGSYHCEYSKFEAAKKLKRDIDKCTNEEECLHILAEKNCTKGKAIFRSDIDPMEVYCIIEKPPRAYVDTNKKSIRDKKLKDRKNLKKSRQDNAKALMEKIKNKNLANQDINTILIYFWDKLEGGLDD